MRALWLQASLASGKLEAQSLGGRAKTRAASCSSTASGSPRSATGAQGQHAIWRTRNLAQEPKHAARSLDEPCWQKSLRVLGCKVLVEYLLTLAVILRHGPGYSLL